MEDTPPLLVLELRQLTQFGLAQEIHLGFGLDLRLDARIGLDPQIATTPTALKDGSYGLVGQLGELTRDVVLRGADGARAGRSPDRP